MKLPAGNWTTADFIVLNRCDSGLIERESRHVIRVMDIDALRKKSPLASLLSAVSEKGRDRQEISLGR
jgi:CRP/FNR family transcriptional regulator, anaerobic regulatory protein